MDDTTDRQLEGWSGVRPDLEVGALQVTARLTRVGAHLARRQDAVFGRFGLGRGEVGALSASRRGTAVPALADASCRALMLSSASITSRIGRLSAAASSAAGGPNDRQGVMVELTDGASGPSIQPWPP
jgi:hypothetical protein